MVSITNLKLALLLGAALNFFFSAAPVQATSLFPTCSGNLACADESNTGTSVTCTSYFM